MWHTSCPHHALVGGMMAMVVKIAITVKMSHDERDHNNRLLLITLIVSVVLMVNIIIWLSYVVWPVMHRGSVVVGDIEVEHFSYRYD